MLGHTAGLCPLRRASYLVSLIPIRLLLVLRFLLWQLRRGEIRQRISPDVVIEPRHVYAAATNTSISTMDLALLKSSDRAGDHAIERRDRKSAVVCRRNRGKPDR